jgi:hypothetical protein
LNALRASNCLPVFSSWQGNEKAGKSRLSGGKQKANGQRFGFISFIA